MPEAAHKARTTRSKACTTRCARGSSAANIQLCKVHSMQLCKPASVHLCKVSSAGLCKPLCSSLSKSRARGRTFGLARKTARKRTPARGRIFRKSKTARKRTVLQVHRLRSFAQGSIIAV